LIANQWRDIGLIIACVASMTAILHEGLRPYDFFVPNQVSWPEGAPGLVFARQGIAATIAKRADSEHGRPAPFSIEVWLRRTASPPADGGAVLSVADGGKLAPLQLSQWRETFYFRFPALHDYVLAEQTLSLKDDFPIGAPRFVALSSGSEGTRAYVEALEIAHVRGRQPLVRSGTNLGGRLVIGNRIHAGRGWTGRIDGLALYARTLTPAELATHAARVRRDGVRTLAGEPGLLGLYAFDEKAGGWARDLAGAVGDLTIPARYRPLGLELLRLREPLPGNPVNYRDVGLNLVGFIPVGLLLFWSLCRWAVPRPASALWLAIVAGFSLSLIIETGQAFLPSRVSTLGDLALNTAGSALGALLAVPVSRLRNYGTRNWKSLNPFHAQP
jgi:hypothetical protein